MRRLWCNPDITLVGRRTLLESKIKPRVNNRSLRFILTGTRDVGKTALLEAAFDLCTSSKKSLINAGRPLKTILEQIAREWGVVVADKTKPTVEELKGALFGCSGNILFIDDIHKSSAVSKIDFFKVLADRNKLCGAILVGAGKENLKPLLSKMGKEIRISALGRKDSKKLSERVCINLGSSLSHIDVSNACSGLPGRIVSMANTNEIQRNEIRSRDEEIDISPLFVLLLCCLVVFRYIGRAQDATDYYLIGGLSLVLILFARYFFQRAS